MSNVGSCDWRYREGGAHPGEFQGGFKEGGGGYKSFIATHSRTFFDVSLGGVWVCACACVLFYNAIVGLLQALG